MKTILCAAVFILWVSGSSQTCIYPACICEKTYMVCRNRQLGMPVTTPMPTPSLDLNLATDLTYGILPSNLTEIYLMNSPVTNISNNAFDDSAATLDWFSISYCRLTQIPNALLRLKVLRSMSIADTHILEWNIDVIIKIGQTLQILYLDNVGLKEWPSWLNQFPRLTELSVVSSSISSIPDNAFNFLASSLISLDLNNNSLIAAPKALQGLSAINLLNLQQNMISDLAWLPRSNKISSISLSDNRISNSSHLSDALRIYGQSLIALEFQNNQLTSIPNLDFLTELETVDLSKNLISDPASGSMASTVYSLDFGNNVLPLIPRILSSLGVVTSFILTSNAIKQIRAGDFSTTVTDVQLGYNLITELTDTSFPQNSTIMSLVLNNNLISKVSPSAFSNLPRLTNLNLQGNKLTRLPQALASLTLISYVDLTDNSKLVCTCLEKGLEHWVMSMSASVIKGNCGLISIYTFFATLSPDCPP